jgi:hypothetical protein
MDKAVCIHFLALGTQVSCSQLAEAIRAAQLAKERGRELQERGARESDVFLLFSDKYALEGDSVDQAQGMAPTQP